MSVCRGSSGDCTHCATAKVSLEARVAQAERRLAQLEEAHTSLAKALTEYHGQVGSAIGLLSMNLNELLDRMTEMEERHDTSLLGAGEDRQH